MRTACEPPSAAVYRYERSGTMHGLFRVRGFTQASSACCLQALREERGATLRTRNASAVRNSAAVCSALLDVLCRPCTLLQDDGHIFCLPSQIESEILGVLDLTEKLLSQFGFQDFEVSAATPRGSSDDRMNLAGLISTLRSTKRIAW